MLVISARLAPFPPSRYFMSLLPSSKSYTYLSALALPHASCAPITRRGRPAPGEGWLRLLSHGPVRRGRATRSASLFSASSAPLLSAQRTTSSLPRTSSPSTIRMLPALMGFMPSLAIVTFTGSRFAVWTKRAAGRACSSTLDPTTTQRVAMGRLRGLGGEHAWRRAHAALHRDSSHPAPIVQCVCTFGPAPVDARCGRPGHLKVTTEVEPQLSV